MKFASLALACTTLLIACKKDNEDLTRTPVMSIGLIAEAQYADKENDGLKKHRNSLEKLQAAIDTFNTNKVNCTQTLGNLIDTNWISFDAVIPIFEQLNPSIPNQHLLGNKDFNIDDSKKKNLIEKLTIPSNYYSYIKNNWKFIVLDATDYSYHGNALHNKDINIINSYYNYTLNKPNHSKDLGAIGQDQQVWLKRELDQSSIQNQRIIIYCNTPIKPANNEHNLWNDFEIINLIKNYSNVVAYINGQNLDGNYAQSNGIHCITLSGMVFTDKNSFGILDIYRDSLILNGYGNQEDLRLAF